MNEEVRRVLNLLSEGKINAAEAEQLIKALEDKHDPDPPDTDRAKKRQPRFLRITVEDCSKGEEGGDRANIRIPLSFLKAGMKLGACIPGGKGEGLRAKLREKGIDLDSLKEDLGSIEDIVACLGELSIDVEGKKKEKVRIVCE